MRRLHKAWGLRPWQRHSLVLMVAGLMYAAIGVAYVTIEPSAERRTALFLAYHWLPYYVWGYAFLGVGLMAIASARWPSFAETWGYMALTGLSVGWALVFLAGVLFFHSPVYNVSAFLVWGMLGFLWWAISGLLNPNHEGVVAHDRYTVG